MTLKKLLSVGLIAAVALGFAGCKYDDDDVWDAINGQEERIAALEKWQQSTNTNIAALQAIVDSSDFIKSVTPITEKGKVIGYTISFQRQGDIVIYHGEKGETGAPGAQGDKGDKGDKGDPGEMPVIGVEQLSDELWYWTLNGQLLKDAQGNPICASGRDGKDGQDGAPGQNGTDGKDGQDAPLPELKYGSALGKGYIADAVYLSVDGGKTWVKVSGDNGKDGQNGAPGQDGTPGAPGTPGSSATNIFSKAPEDMGSYWLFTLANGTEIKVAKYDLLMLTAVIDGQETAITGGELEVAANTAFTIKYEAADKQSRVAVRVTDKAIEYTEGAGSVEFAAVPAKSEFTVLFVLIDYYNQTRLYKVTVTTGEGENTVIIDGEKNEELADAISDALGLPKDENGDVALTPEVIENTKSLNLSGKDLTDVSALDVFTNLEDLNLANNDISEIDLSKLSNLKTLNISDNPLTELDLSAQTELEDLNCSNCFNQQPASRSGGMYGKLDLSAHKKLKYLNCSNNSLTELNVSENDSLRNLICRNNQLTSINVTNNDSLIQIDCTSNKISTLDLSKNVALTTVTCVFNQLSVLDLSNNHNVKFIECAFNSLTELKVSHLSNLYHLGCRNNKIKDLDVSKNGKLKHLNCLANNLSSINLSNNPLLEELSVCYNAIDVLELGNNQKLTSLYCRNCHLKTLDVTKCSQLAELYCGNQENASGNVQEMILILTEAQLAKWNSGWKSSEDNANVKVSDQAVSEAGGNGANFGNGGVF